MHSQIIYLNLLSSLQLRRWKCQLEGTSCTCQSHKGGNTNPQGPWTGRNHSGLTDKSLLLSLYHSSMFLRGLDGASPVSKYYGSDIWLSVLVRWHQVILVESSLSAPLVRGRGNPPNWSLCRLRQTCHQSRTVDPFLFRCLTATCLSICLLIQ